MANKVYNLSGGLYSGDAFTAFETQLAASKGGNLIASPTDYKVSTGTGMNVSIAAGSAIIGNGTNSGIRVGSDAANTVAVSAASTANPRKDAVVMYIDKSVSPSTSVTDNTDLGILKFKVVAGSPAASPNAPTASAIQSSIGAGNPYMILANITVPKSATAASGFTIEDMRVLPASLIPASAIGTDQLANASVTSPKIDWTTLETNTDTHSIFKLGEMKIIVGKVALNQNVVFSQSGGIAISQDLYINLPESFTSDDFFVLVSSGEASSGFYSASTYATTPVSVNQIRVTLSRTSPITVGNMKLNYIAIGKA